jgi:hypothetical protein
MLKRIEASQERKSQVLVMLPQPKKSLVAAKEGTNRCLGGSTY